MPLPLTGGEVRDEKAAMRARMRALRAELAGEPAARLAAAAVARLTALPALATARTVALYAAVRGEADPAAAARTLRPRGVRVAYPRVVEGGALAFCHVDDERELELAPGRFGVAEPGPEAPIVPGAALDLVVVPALAFDAAGRRLGYGRGFYDRALRAAPRALRVGFGFGGQLVARVPADGDDEPVDWVVTDAATIETGARAGTEG